MDVMLTDVLVIERGSSLLADAAAGASVLMVEDPTDFGDSAADEGVLELGGLRYDYAGVDPDTGALTLVSPLTEAATTGDPVWVVVGDQVATDWIALCDGGEGEGMEASLPFAFRALLAEGHYDPPVPVKITDEPNPRVIEADGRRPVIPVEYVDRATSQEQLDARVTAEIAAVNAAVQADLATVNASIAAGDSENAQAINAAVNDFTAGLATKSKHTLSPNSPGTTANNVGDVWEQHKTGDATKIIARYRGQGGTAWLPMNLDATYIPQLDIGTGTFGDLDGVRIKARSIGVETLVVGVGPNLISNPSAERAVDRAAFPANGVLTYQASATTGYGLAKSGAWMFRLNTVPVGYDYKQFAADIPVLPGEQYRLGYWSKRWYTNATVGVSFRALDTAGTPGDWNVGLLSTSTSDPNGGWVYRSQIFEVPAGIFGLRPYLTTRGGGGADVWFIDDVSLTRAYTGELIVDGSIRTNHLYTDFVETLLLTGKVLQTDAAGNRGIKMSNSGLVAFDSTGTATFSVDPATGSIAMKGTATAAGTITGASIVGSSFATATGYGDITITPGNSSANPAAVEFWPMIASIDITAGNRPSITAFTSVSGPFETATIRLLGPKAINATTRPRIDISTNRVAGAGAQPVTADMVYHAGGQYGGVGRHYFKIDDVTKLEIAANGLTVAPLAGSATGALYVTTAGLLTRSSSSERYKRDIEPMTLEQAQTALAVDAVTFNWRDAESLGPQREPGFIAEQADEVGADLWVYRDAEGRPTSYRYAEMVPAHNVLIRDLYSRIEALEAHVA